MFYLRVIWTQYISLSAGKSDEMKMIDMVYPSNKNSKHKAKEMETVKITR